MRSSRVLKPKVAKAAFAAATARSTSASDPREMRAQTLLVGGIDHVQGFASTGSTHSPLI
jgi:hypothetical protein